jgi:thiopeptide-type bacteriocin biosynthesis protein
MDSRDSRHLFASTDTALMRAAAHARLALPACPDPAGVMPGHVDGWCTWLREIWAVDAVAGAVGHASPALARQMEAVRAGHRPSARQARRMVLAMIRYVQRMTGRATPFGLFAGVAPATFGPRPVVRWGSAHRAVARADASWLTDIITQLESCPQLLERLPLLTSNLCFVRGGRLIMPGRLLPSGGAHAGAAEVSIRHTTAVRVAVEAARSPIRYADLAAKLAAEFPAAPPPVISGLLASLIQQGVLISSLHAPGTVIDAFGYLMDQLDAAGADGVPQAAGVVQRLREINAELEGHNRAVTPTAGWGIGAPVGGRMSALSATARQPIAVDLRLDCTLTLPRQVAQEAEAAAGALARLSPHPFGAPAWQSYHTRFFERYGIGALVPVLDVVDPDAGLGFPDGYLAAAAPEPQAPVSARDERLLAMAQGAALDGRDEITLDEPLIDGLAATGDPERMQIPPHIELCFQVQAASQAALGRGQFGLTVVSVSRAAGSMTGRFTSLLEPPGQQRLARTFAHLPTCDPGAMLAQLSFSPLNPATAHITRTPSLLPATISLGEYRHPDGIMIALEDLAVACDSERLYLASLSVGRRVEPVMLHALDLRAHTPPLARFLAEVGRAQAAVVTGFDWGAAAGLPFLPRVRYRRTVLSPARWLLGPADLPGRQAPWPEWEQAMTAWRFRRRLPGLVYLAEGDRRLPLDLDQAGHRALLRAHLDSGRQAVLTEAPGLTADRWCGGRAHEIVVPLVAARPPHWSPVPPVTAARLIGRGHGHLPGASPWLYAKLYGHPERQAEILATWLPDLLSEWDEPPPWWFIRYRDPECHLRLRIALPGSRDFGTAARHVSAWAGGLRRLGLLRDVQFATYYPETGRWGSGPLMAAAEDVFAADSRALAAQFAEPSPPHPQVLAAAHFAAITVGFCGSTDAGMAWLARYAKTASGGALPRQVRAEAIRLADPSGGWAALRAQPGGQPITGTFTPRQQALTRYRALLTGADGTDPDAVLVSLLHAHHIRAAGIDRAAEHTCLRLARAAALALTARTRAGQT